MTFAENKSDLYVPPEETRHERTFMQWPASRKVYRDSYFLKSVQETIARIANVISEFEPVVLLASAEEHKRIRKLVSENVELWDIPTEDLWCRDSGPLFAIRDTRELVVSHIQFNGWGNKQIHERDGQIARLVAERLGVSIVSIGVTGEAGGVEHNGHGLLMAHESSWVNENRNASFSRKEIGDRLLKAYGAQQILWSKGVYGEDITDYHIDSLARFTGEKSVLINLPKTPDSLDPFHKAALDTHDLLVASGLYVDVIYEPVRRRVKGYDFVASYANYYVCNGAVIAAQFGDKQADANAAEALKRHFEGREIITLNVDALGKIGGGIHCATQQMPAV